MSDIVSTPLGKKKSSKLRRSYAIADIAVESQDAAANDEHEVYDPRSRPAAPAETHVHAAVNDEDFEYISDNEPTPKKRQKTTKVPVRETINSNRKEFEHEPHKAENKVSPSIS